MTVPSTTPAPDAPQEFDYLVVGGGSAGAVVAARLSEDPSVAVGLIEAGPHDRGIDEVLTLSRWMELLESGYDWDYPVEEQENGNSHMRMARAKVLGGCSSHNSCIEFWAPAEDLDEWEEKHGAEGWNAETAFRLYRKLETNDEAGAAPRSEDLRVSSIHFPLRPAVRNTIRPSWSRSSAARAA